MELALRVERVIEYAQPVGDIERPGAVQRVVCLLRNQVLPPEQLAQVARSGDQTPGGGLGHPALGYCIGCPAGANRARRTACRSAVAAPERHLVADEEGAVVA